MLSKFDWIRCSQTGAELLATLEYLADSSELFADDAAPGSPHSALNGPCQRCWVYSRWDDGARKSLYCEACHKILIRAGELGYISRISVVVWGFVQRLSPQIREGEGIYGHQDPHVLGAYIRDRHRFLLMLPCRELKPWLQELMLYYGADIKGLIQIFPTTGVRRDLTMNDVLCRAVYHESRFAMDKLRVRFFSAPHQVMKPHRRDEQGLLTFEVSDFLNMLEMAAIFRTILLPKEQKWLYSLLNLEETGEEQFYWGRFLGMLTPKAKDMLNAWKIRLWPPHRVNLLYELANYVEFYQTD